MEDCIEDGRGEGKGTNVYYYHHVSDIAVGVLFLKKL